MSLRKLNVILYTYQPHNVFYDLRLAKKRITLDYSETSNMIKNTHMLTLSINQYQPVFKLTIMYN